MSTHRFRPRHIARKNVAHVSRTSGNVIGEREDGKPIRGMNVDGKPATGLFPVVVVDMKAGSRGNQKQAAYWMTKLGLDCKLVQTVGDVETYATWGSGEALEQFLAIGTARGFVKDWSMPVNTRVGFVAAGSGPEKTAKHRRPMPYHA